MAEHTAQRRRRRSRLKPAASRVLGRGLLYAAVLLIAFWSLFPIVYMFAVSASQTRDVVSAPPRLSWPPTLLHYRRLLFADTSGGSSYFGDEGSSYFEGKQGPVFVMARQIPVAIANSVIVALGTTAINLVIGSLAGYSMARYSTFWFNDATLNLLMLTRMLPGLALLIPFFVVFRVSGLLYTLHGLIIAYSSFILPLTIYVMRGYFASVPRSLEWSAQVDGCTWFQGFWRIFLPVSVPGLAAAGIFAFLVAWNEFLFALILVSKLDVQTVPLAIVSMVYGENVLRDYPALFAAGVLAVIPPLVIAFAFQRYLIQGMLAGATKG